MEGMTTLLASHSPLFYFPPLRLAYIKKAKNVLAMGGYYTANEPNIHLRGMARLKENRWEYVGARSWRGM
jgi:hypothetical protein